MPIAQMKTNYKFPSPELRTAFLDEAAKELSEILRKPLPAIMVMLDQCPMYMNSSEEYNPLQHTVFLASCTILQYSRYPSL